MNGLKKKSVRLILCVTVAIAVCLSVSGCLSEKYSVSTLSGTFEESWIFYFSVTLNPDGTYKFHYMYDITDLSSDGNWWIEGKYVILNSFIQNEDCFPVDVYRVDSLSQTDGVLIICDRIAYKNSLMYFLTDDTIAINSDTSRLNCRSFPDTINLFIEPRKVFSLVLSAKSDDIIIREPGVYRIETKGIFLRERPLNYLVLKRRKFKILSKDSFQDVNYTNATLKRITSY